MVLLLIMILGWGRRGKKWFFLLL